MHIRQETSSGSKRDTFAKMCPLPGRKAKQSCVSLETTKEERSNIGTGTHRRVLRGYFIASRRTVLRNVH